MQKWQHRNQRRLQKNEFVDLLCSIWHQGLSPENVISGFKSTGIFPLDRSKYPTDRLDPQKLARHSVDKNRPNAGREQIAATDNNDIVSTPNESHRVDSSPANGFEAAPERRSSEGNPRQELQNSTDDCSPNLRLSPVFFLHGERAATSPDQPSASTQTNATTSSQSSTSCTCSGHSSVDVSPTFENLLLQKISKSNPTNKCRRKIDTGAAVITSEDYLKKITEKNKDRQGAKEKPRPTKAVKRKIIAESNSSSSDEDWLASGDSLEDINLLDADESSCFQPDSSDYTPNCGDFVLTVFKGGKRSSISYRYVCVVQKILDEHEVEVQCFKSVEGKKSTFKIIDGDISAVKLPNIIGKLPHPEVVASGDRVKYVFNQNVDVYESH